VTIDSRQRSDAVTNPRSCLYQAVANEARNHHRAVVNLTYWEDMTDKMAAEHIEISAGSVRR